MPNFFFYNLSCIKGPDEARLARHAISELQKQEHQKKITEQEQEQADAIKFSNYPTTSNVFDVVNKQSSNNFKCNNGETHFKTEPSSLFVSFYLRFYNLFTIFAND